MDADRIIAAFAAVCDRYSLVNMLLANPRVKHLALVQLFPVMMNVTLMLAVLCNAFLLFDYSNIGSARNETEAFSWSLQDFPDIDPHNNEPGRGVTWTLFALGILMAGASVLRLCGYVLMWLPVWVSGGALDSGRRDATTKRKPWPNLVDYRDTDDRPSKRCAPLAACKSVVAAKARQVSSQQVPPHLPQSAPPHSASPPVSSPASR